MAFLGRLKVTIVEARGIKMPGLGTPDPYVKIETARKSHKTHHKNNEKKPQYNETFTFDGIETNQPMTLEVWDHDTFSPDDIIGS